MLDRVAERIARFAVTNPSRVIVGALLASAVSLAFGATHLALRTSNLDLVRPTLPRVRAFLDFSQTFGTPNALVVVLEGADTASLERAVDRLAPLLEAAPGVRAVVGRLPLPDATIEELGLPAYTGSDDGTMRFLFVQPDDPLSRADTIEPFVRNVRSVIDRELHNDRITVGFTGLPEYALNDRDVIQRDISRLSILAFVLVLAIFVTTFGTFLRPLLAMASLLIAVSITLGLTAIYPGHLTLLSAFFASILFGLGVDYGIHIVGRVEELLVEGRDPATAIVEAVTTTARPLATGAATTAAAFYTMLFSGFRGFEELGFVAGTGILLCLLSMLIVLPALLSAFALRGRVRASRRLAGVMALARNRGLAVIIVMLALGLAMMPRAGFDSDYLNLEPRDSEAARIEQRMVDRSDLSPQFAAFVANDQDEAITLTNRLLDDPTVGDVMSLAELEVAAGEDTVRQLPPGFVSGLRSPDGRYAVYAYPAGNVWQPDQQQRFVSHMTAIDPDVTGMPVLGRFMMNRSKRALVVTAILAGVMLLVVTWLDFRSFAPTVLASLPTMLTVVSLPALMKLVGVDFNPLNVMALPVVIGIAVDNGVHIVHRFRMEQGDVTRVLTGTGRSILLTSLTTLASFGSLALTSHRGLASFAIVLSLGVTSALFCSISVLPAVLELTGARVLPARNEGIARECEA